MGDDLPDVEGGNEQRAEGENAGGMQSGTEVATSSGSRDAAGVAVPPEPPASSFSTPPWLKRVRMRYLALRSQGWGQEAHNGLKVALRTCSAAVSRFATVVLPTILDRAEEDHENQACAATDVEQWVVDCIDALTLHAPQQGVDEPDLGPAMSMPGAREPTVLVGSGRRVAANAAGAPMVTPEPLPFGILHAAHVWPNNTWSSLTDMETIAMSGSSGAGAPVALGRQHPRATLHRRNRHPSGAEVREETAMTRAIRMPPPCLM